MKKTLRNYQKKAIKNTLEALPSKPCVLAFCTGGGKTFTAHELINKWTKANPSKRVLILTHNQVVLRKNFLTDGFYEVTKTSLGSEIKKQSKVVAIPSTIKDKNIGKFGLLVFDEAHEFFGKKMVNEIRKKIGKHQLLLLTASHGQFKSDTYHKELYSVMEGYDDGYLAKDTKIEIISTAWNFTEEDYKNTEDLRGDYEFSTKEVKSACEAILKKMSETEKAKGKTFSFLNRKLEIKGKLTKVSKINELPKTLIACHNVKMADMMYSYFDKKFPGQILVSYSKTTKGVDADDSGERMLQFKNEPDKRMLIVVRRGILGYDVPETEYVIDLTASKNVDRTTQLLGRVLRKNGDLRKHYFKVVPDYLENYTWYQMGAVVALFHPVNNEKWTGQSSQVPILTKEVSKPKSKKGSSKKVSSKTKGIKVPKAIIDFEEYRHVFVKADADECIWMRRERFTTLASVRGHRRGEDPDGNKRKLLDSILNGQPRPNNRSALGGALTRYTNGIYADKTFKDRIIKIDEEINSDNKGWMGWTENKMLNLFNGVESIKDFKEKYHGAYDKAKRKKYQWFVFSDKRPKTSLMTKEEIALDGQKYLSLTDWKKSNPKVYDKAQRLGILKLCGFGLGLRNKIKIKCEETGEIFDSLTDAAIKLGIHYAGISKQLKGKQKSAGGYTFSYVEEE